MVMELRVLRYVVAVAERLNFTLAARDLNVSQPAMSQQIKQLEDELGLQLFARTPHRVTLTQAGQMVVDHARRTLDSAGRLRESVDAFRGLQRGRLRIAVTQSFNALHLTPVLAAFLEAYPEIDVSVFEWANGAIIAGVEDGTLDLGVAFSSNDAPVRAEPLYDDQLMFACSTTHALASRVDVSLALLAAEPMALLPVAFGIRRSLDRFFEMQSFRPCRVIELDKLASILNLVETGVCVSVLPGLSVNTGSLSEGVAFRPLYPAPPTRSIQLLLPATMAQSPSAAAFASLLRDRFRSNRARASGGNPSVRHGP